jgi:hypothetical protein
MASAVPFIPDFSSAMFSDSLDIDNPYLPLEPGTNYLYHTNPVDGGPEDSERILVEVLQNTKTILGIETRVVRDRVWKDGLIIEDTFDWFAQDDNGNVWYMGEYVTDYLYDPNGVLTGTIHDGSWEAGVDGAQPGFIMEAYPPTVGHNYYQEYYVGEAEDQATVLALDEMISIALGTFDNVLKNEEKTDLDPDSLEHKFYALDVGKILGYHLDPETDEITEITRLIAVTPEPGTAVLVVLGAAWVVVGARRRISPCHCAE